MNTAPPKYPYGLQTFANLREGGYVYVDKTDLIYDMVNTSTHVFLSRPRRFGKSLLVSTLEAYFKGRKDLFDGLALGSLADQWTEYPVLRMDLSAENYESMQVLEAVLDYYLCQWEAVYGKSADEQTMSRRFAGVIRRAHALTGKPVVILVDEYDSPIIANLENEPLAARMRAALKAFYGNVKREDAHIRFSFITGVSRFSRVSIFSDLNNLRDISMVDRYATICGITQSELEKYFARGIDDLGKTLGLDRQTTLATLRRHYDGYHFTANCPGLYNPFSLICTFTNEQISDYWYSTGTTTFLAKKVKNDQWMLSDLEHAVSQPSALADIESYRDPVPLLFQTGYLTIKSYRPESNDYMLDYPNIEVRNGFVQSLFDVYVKRGLDTGFSIQQFRNDIMSGRTDAFMRRLAAMLACIPAQFQPRHYEYEFQNIVYIVFMMLGTYAQTGVSLGQGRADMVVRVPGAVYIFEFKYGGRHTPAEALSQIIERDYARPFEAANITITAIGAVYEPASGRLQWESKTLC